MCFVEAFTSLFISPLKFGVLPLPLSFLKGSKNTCLWQVNGSRKPWTVQFLAGTGTSDFLNPYALAAWTLHGGSDLFNQISKIAITLFALSTPTLILQLQLYLALFCWTPSLKIKDLSVLQIFPEYMTVHWFSALWLVPVLTLSQNCVQLWANCLNTPVKVLVKAWALQ